MFNKFVENECFLMTGWRFKNCYTSLGTNVMVLGTDKSMLACSAEQDGLSNFGRGSPKEHSCEIIEKSIQQYQGRSIFKVNNTMNAC